MLKKYIKKRKYYFIAFAIALVSVLIMVVGLILDELSYYGDSTEVKCGAIKINGGPLEGSYSDCSDLSDGCKKAETAGILWIVFNVIAIICCFIPIGLLGVKKSLSFIPYIFSVIFYLLAVIMWVADNPICYATNLEPSIGASLILAIIASFFALIALIVAAYPKFCQK